MTDLIENIQGTVVLVCGDGDGDRSLVRSEQDAVDLVAAASEHDADWVALPVARLDPDFFRLRTGVAGEVVQKFVTYRRGLAIVGDVAVHVSTSEAFRDFVRECNRGRQTWFVADLDELRAKVTQQTS